MPLQPDHQLTLAREMLALPGAGEPQWRAAVRFAADAVFLAVAAATGRDPATFAGNPRAVRDALFDGAAAEAPPFLALARRHWNTLWLAALRAAYSQDERVSGEDAHLCVALAERILHARSASLM